MRASAIDKRPVSEPVFVGPLGLAGDEQAQRRIHGGPVKAVYVYAAEDLAWWSAELGRPIGPGFIGENLTITGIDLHALRPGDELHAAEVILRVTQPRDPCANLAARMGIAGFEKQFGRVGRTGVYCAVVRDGHVRSGEALAVADGGEPGPSIREILVERYGVDLPSG